MYLYSIFPPLFVWFVYSAALIPYEEAIFMVHIYNNKLKLLILINFAALAGLHWYAFGCCAGCYYPIKRLSCNFEESICRNQTTTLRSHSTTYILPSSTL